MSLYILAANGNWHCILYPFYKIYFMAERGNPTGTPYSGTNEDRSNNGTNQQQSQKGRGDEQYKNIQTKVGNREYYGEDYAVEQEEEMGREEAKTENENRPGRS